MRRCRLWQFVVLVGAALAAGPSLLAQIPGRNVNMVSGTGWPDGDPFLQRQNEPSMAASTRNPLHLVAGSNDYRTVDVPIPGIPGDEDPNQETQTGDAWVSVYKSFDGGQRWSSTLMPGYPQDTSPAGIASPLKGYQAAADPVVRAGTNGLLYYNGLVFDRGDNGKSAIFLARFIDRNNKENGDPIAYLGTSLVATSDGTAFLDKPWMAVDVPRGTGLLCSVGGVATGAKVRRNGHRLRGASGQVGGADTIVVDAGVQYVPAGPVYVAYTSITGDGDTLRSEVLLKRSLDCGATWSAPMRVSRATDRVNQGATIAIDPVDGDVFVAWRRFASPDAPSADAVMVARLPGGAGAFAAPGLARALPNTSSPSAALDRIFEHRKKRAQTSTTTAQAPAGTPQLDQGTSPYSFRSNAYPAMTIDGASRVYVAWSERGFAAAPGRGSATDGDARIRITTTLDGTTFTAPVVADNSPLEPGHQLMPTLTFAGGRLLLVFYDLRETRAGVFGQFVSDQPSLLPFNKRQTIDIRAALGTPGAAPAFAPSVRVSDYAMGFKNGARTADFQPEQLQFNPPNLPMFKQGTVPFIGDYIDVTPAPAFVPTTGGGWTYNTAATIDLPLFHAVWTDNRDVRAPRDGNWANYTRPNYDGPLVPGQVPGQSLFDPSQTLGVCSPSVFNNAGSRNQNVYTARIGGGLLVGSPGNAKPLSPTLQRAFVVFAQNNTTASKTFRMSVQAQPVGGRASFEQFAPTPPTPLITAIEVKVPARSTASRTLYVTSTDATAQVAVNVVETDALNGPVSVGGLAGRVVLNPDIENPDIENPDIENLGIDNTPIRNAEVYNPDIENPDIENPDIENPDIENPDIENPDIENINVANPDIENVTVANPDIRNPDIENPDIENPDIENPDIENGTFSDITWTVSNTGNTTSAFNANLFLATVAPLTGLKTQLVVYKTYKTPVLDPNGCDLRTETRNIVMYNINQPTFITATGGAFDQNDPTDKNATLWLAPGELGRVTLRVYDSNRFDNVVITNLDGSTASIDPRLNPTTVLTLGVAAQGVDFKDPDGAKEPPVVTSTGTNLFFLQQPTTAVPGVPIAPMVRVRVYDNAGAALAGVPVTLTLLDAPVGAVLSGNSDTSDGAGIAEFPLLSVNVASTNVRLRADASASGVIAAGTSAPFNVGVIAATVTITNPAQIFNGTPRPVTVTTVPPGLAVSVTYNSSATAPTAIGAYNVVATVTSPGYTGSATATQTVASTLTAGGPGGSAYPPSGALSCGAGVFANGVRAATNGPPNGGFGDISYALTSGQLLCSNGVHPGQFGGTTTPNSDLTCSPGQVMVGLFGTTGGPGFNVVTSVGARCQSTAGGVVTQTSAAPGFGTPFGPIDCPAGQAVTGVVGGQGAVVDSIALVCAPVAAAPAITSIVPSAQVSGSQMLTIYGTNLPAASLNDVLFNQGGGDVPANYMWSADASRAIVRLPGLAPGVPTTVRLKNPAGTITTTPFPITISNTPGTPVLVAVLNQCGPFATPITTVSPGGPLAIEGDGIDTTSTQIVYTPITATGSVLTQSFLSSTGGPTGRVCSYEVVPADPFPATGAPAGLTSGTWLVQIRTSTLGVPSALSNGIVLTVP